MRYDDTGDSLLAAIVVLAIMILPSIISVSETALNAVPREYEEASLALGATELETYFRVSAPAAKSGIAAAVVLGVGRAIGEAMAILMVAGNVANMPSLLTSVKFLTTAIAGEMGYADGLHRQALFSIGLVLFLFIMLINAALNLFLKRIRYFITISAENLDSIVLCRIMRCRNHNAGVRFIFSHKISNRGSWYHTEYNDIHTDGTKP